MLNKAFPFLVGIIVGLGIALITLVFTTQAQPSNIPQVNKPLLCDLDNKELFPIADFGCDSPELRIFIYDHFINVKFKHEWNPAIWNWMCQRACNGGIDEKDCKCPGF